MVLRRDRPAASGSDGLRRARERQTKRGKAVETQTEEESVGRMQMRGESVERGVQTECRMQVGAEGPRRGD